MAGPEGAHPSEIATAAARVGAIVEAAERAAEDLRARTEQRAAERIAEADRAAELRVRAGEEEAAELLAAARAEAQQARAAAEQAVRHIHAEAARIHREAEREAERLKAEALSEGARLRAEASDQAALQRERARADARAIVGEAHIAARRVLREGGELSDQLEQLSTSLHRNAERLLTDIAAAHHAMTAELDAVVPGAGADLPPEDARAEDRPPRGGTGDVDVPEFVPPRRDATMTRDPGL